MGVQGSAHPLRARLLERTRPESHAVRNELTIAYKLERQDTNLRVAHQDLCVALYQESRHVLRVAHQSRGA